MKIEFYGCTPSKTLFAIGVQGDNLTDKIECVIDCDQDGTDIAAFSAQLKIIARDGSYVQKTDFDGDEIEDGKRHLTYMPTTGVTMAKAVDMQIQLLSTAGEVWQSETFTAVFADTLDTDTEIVTEYPTEITDIEAELYDHENRITTLEEDMELVLGKDFTELPDTIHTLQEGLAAETAERKEADEDLTTAIVGESEARETADAALDARLTTLENTSFDGLADAVHNNTEMAREALKTANQATDDLTQEIKDRESACEALQGALTDASDALGKSIEETKEALETALQASQSELQKAIDEETEARKTADDALTASVESEAQLRTEADAALTQSLAEETAAREAADDALREALTEASEDANQALKDAESALTASIESEAAERKSADETLTASVESATTSLTASIDAETEARKEADTELSAAIETAQEAAIDAAKEYADDITLSITESADTYVFTFTLSNGSKTLASESIDLPLEEMIIGGHYDAAAKEIVLTLRTGQTITFSVSDLVEGLVNESDLNEAVTGLEEKIAAALADAEGYADAAVNAETAAREASESALSEAIATAQSAADAAQKTADGKIDKDTADSLYDEKGAADNAEDAAKAYTDAELENYVTEADAADTYQPIGDYATRDEATAAASEAESAAKAYVDEGLAGKQDKLTAAGSATNPVYIDEDGEPKGIVQDDGDVAIGDGAVAETSNADNGSNVAIGYNATASGSSCYEATAIGWSAKASIYNATAVGRSCTASGAGSAAIGNTSTASGRGSIAVGGSDKAQGEYSIAIGYGATAPSDYDVAIGTQTKGAANKGVWLNAGLMTETDELATSEELQSTASELRTAIEGVSDNLNFATDTQVDALFE